MNGFTSTLQGYFTALHWRHNGRDSVSNHQPHECLLNRLFRRRSKKTSKLRVTGLCVGNSPGTGEFPAQMASNAENVSISWRHHGGEHKIVAAFVKQPWRLWMNISLESVTDTRCYCDMPIEHNKAQQNHVFIFCNLNKYGLTHWDRVKHICVSN